MQWPYVHQKYFASAIRVHPKGKWLGGSENKIGRASFTKNGVENNISEVAK